MQNSSRLRQRFKANSLNMDQVFEHEVKETEKKIMAVFGNDPYSQMMYLLQVFGSRHKNISRAKLVSDKTQENRQEILLKALKDLRSLNFRIRNVYNISSRHIHALYEHYEKERADKQMKTTDFPGMHSIFGAFMQWIGKPNWSIPLPVDTNLRWIIATKE